MTQSAPPRTGPVIDMPVATPHHAEPLIDIPGAVRAEMDRRQRNSVEPPSLAEIAERNTLRQERGARERAEAQRVADLEYQRALEVDRPRRESIERLIAEKESQRVEARATVRRLGEEITALELKK